MSETTCSVPGCLEPRKGLGYCNRHYLRVLRTGTPGGLRPPALSPICSVDDCGRPRACRGYCTLHYSRWRNWGNALMTPEEHYAAALAARFWSRVDKSGDCWEWKGTRDVDGYGKFHYGSHDVIRAHRLSFIMANGIAELSSEIVVRHHCDNPPCVRPDHLASGTPADNNSDCASRGRQARGDRHGARLKPHTVRRGALNGMAKLDEDLVRQIRLLSAAGEYQKHIAALTGVTQGTVSKIVLRKIWAHVN